MHLSKIIVLLRIQHHFSRNCRTASFHISTTTLYSDSVRTLMSLPHESLLLRNRQILCISCLIILFASTLLLANVAETHGTLQGMRFLNLILLIQFGSTAHFIAFSHEVDVERMIRGVVSSFFT